MKQGFTLMEVIVVVAVSSALILVLLNLFERQGSLYSYQKSQIEVTSGARLAMMELNKYTSQAYRVISDRTINSNTYSSNTTTMILQLPAIDGSGNVISNTWDYVVFTLNGTKLIEIVSPDGSSARVGITRDLASTITNLIFTYDNNTLSLAKKVNVDMTSSEQVRSQTVTNRAVQDIVFLNYY